MPVHNFEYNCLPCHTRVHIRVEEKPHTLPALEDMTTHFPLFPFRCPICRVAMEQRYFTNATFLDVVTAVGECA